MASTSFSALALFVMMIIGSSNAQLTPEFYSKSCPQLPWVISSVVRSAIQKEARMGASLLRLFFHDCFVQGCDGSILLDGRNNEKFSSPSFQSARGFEVVDQIKSAVEKVCPGVVSCADVLAITARDSVHMLGGPYWDVKLGRRDSKTANQALANSSIPNAASSLSKLISSFKAQGLSVKDLVALYGGHTIGDARCINFRGHAYMDKNIDKSYAKSLQSSCPSKNGTGDNNLQGLDANTPTKFDNTYFTGLMNKKALLHSDQELYNGGGSTDSIVKSYSSNAKLFNSDFVEGMIKMGDIKPLTGSQGEIRKNCRVPN